MTNNKRILGIHWLLVLSLIAGLALPTANTDAAAKSKKKKVLVVYFSATGTTKSAAKKVKKQRAVNFIRLSRQNRIRMQT